jgi:hypothetical protein
MGRPLNKKYFGNRNIGTGGYQVDESAGGSANAQNYADDRIGGGALGSVSNGTVGAIQINNTYKTFPSLIVADPLLPGGVTAILVVTWEIAAVTIGGTNTGYTNSQTGVAATLTGLGGSIIIPTFTINTNGTGNVSAINVTNRGSWTSIDGTGITTGYSINGAGGTNAMATVTFRVKSIAVTNQGSGYTTTPALSWSQVNGGTMPSAQTVTMLVDNGLVGTAGNQENAIIMYANVSGSGSTGVRVDVIRQVSGTRYKVTDGSNVGIVKLGTDNTPATGNAYLVATATGGTYYVTKLTAHKATLVAKTGDEALDGQSVQWTFGSPTATIVQIENA